MESLELFLKINDGIGRKRGDGYIVIEIIDDCGEECDGCLYDEFSSLIVDNGYSFDEWVFEDYDSTTYKIVIYFNDNGRYNYYVDTSEVPTLFLYLVGIVVISIIIKQL